MNLAFVYRENFSNLSAEEIYFNFLKNDFVTKEKVSYTFPLISHSPKK